MIPGGTLPEVRPALVQAPVPPVKPVNDQPGLALALFLVPLGRRAGDALSRRDSHPRPPAEHALVRVVAALAQAGLAAGVETGENSMLVHLFSMVSVLHIVYSVLEHLFLRVYVLLYSLTEKQ